MSKNLNVTSCMWHQFEEPCIFVFFGVVNGGIFVDYNSVAFTVACLCAATALHNSEHKKSRKWFYLHKDQSEK